MTDWDSIGQTIGIVAAVLAAIFGGKTGVDKYRNRRGASVPETNGNGHKDDGFEAWLRDELGRMREEMKEGFSNLWGEVNGVKKDINEIKVQVGRIDERTKPGS